MFTLNNDFPIINRISTYKKELNAIQKLCRVNMGKFGKKVINVIDNCKMVL
jgi:hypothetical protein